MGFFRHYSDEHLHVINHGRLAVFEQVTELLAKGFGLLINQTYRGLAQVIEGFVESLNSAGAVFKKHALLDFCLDHFSDCLCGDVVAI